MSDNYCRVYDKEALRMLVVENELEDRARIKKQNSLQAKKSGSKSISAKRSSLVASESENSYVKKSAQMYDTNDLNMHSKFERRKKS